LFEEGPGKKDDRGNSSQYANFRGKREEASLGPPSHQEKTRWPKDGAGRKPRIDIRLKKRGKV